MGRSAFKFMWACSSAAWALAGCGGDGESIEHDDHARMGGEGIQQAERRAIGPMESDDDAVVVYESRRFFGPDGIPEGLEEHGKLTPMIRQRVARPSSYLGEDEPFVYDEDVFSFSREDGTGESVYRVLRRPNANPVVRRADERALVVAPRYEEALAKAERDGGTLRALIKMRGYRTWDVPMAPDASLSMEDQERVWAQREEALEAREQSFEQETAKIRAALDGLGAQVLGVRWMTGWLFVEVDAEAARALMSRGDIVRLDVDAEVFENCNGSCNLAGGSTWRMGEGRRADRMNIDVFHANGFTGESANSGFHSFNDINVAIIERNGPFAWEDEASFMDDWQNGTSRVAKRVACSSTSSGGSQQCNTSSNFADTETGTSHSTLMMSIIAGDYSQNQADASAHGDSCWDGVSHCADWEDAATGMAPEASLQLWAGATSQFTLDNAISAIANSSTQKADVISMSTSHHESNRCDVNSSFTFEDALEVAFNEGIFLVNGPENAGSTDLTQCNLDSPGDLPVVFTVNGFNANSSTCRGSYQQCLRSTGSSAVGGADLVVNGLTYSRAHSAIDMQAPSGVSFISNKLGDGTVSSSSISGTSIAAPHVAGAAALIKEQHLAEGQTWINNVGRLHTVMLAMGDRHQGLTQAITGFDDVHGAGKLKLKYITNFGTGANQNASRRMRTLTTTSTGTYTYKPFESLKLPASTQLVKCVLFEDELMGDGTDVDDVGITMRLRDAGSNGVCDATDPVVWTASDLSFDLKHMVSVSDAQVELEDTCVEVDIRRFHISTDGYAQVHSYCYYDDDSDD